MTVAHVRWIDSAIWEGDHFDEEDLEGYHEMVSAGLLIKEDENSITIALDRSETTNSLRCVLCIPRIAVKSVEYFETES